MNLLNLYFTWVTVKNIFLVSYFKLIYFNRCTGVGRTGWHIDGSFQEKPFTHAIYHIIECPKEGATVFAPLTEIVESLPAEKRCWWERIYMVSDRRRKLLHPLIYSHPETKKPVLCFHLVKYLNFERWKNQLDNWIFLMGLCHPLDGISNLKYTLLYFLTPNKIIFWEEGASF